MPQKLVLREVKPKDRTKEPYFAVKAVGPRSVARFPHLDAPDTEGKFADDKFKTDMVADPDDAYWADLREGARMVAEATWGKAAFNKDGSPAYDFSIRDGNECVDKKTGEVFDMMKDKLWLRSKSSRAPALFGPDGEELPEGVIIRSGDVIRVSGDLLAFQIKRDKVVTFRLNSVKLIKQRPSGATADEFPDEDDEVADTALRSTAEEEERPARTGAGRPAARQGARSNDWKGAKSSRRADEASDDLDDDIPF